MIKILTEWLPIIAWLFVVSAAKVANSSKEKKLTRGEIFSEIIYTYFGGVLAFLTIQEQRITNYPWIIITASASGGAELLKFFMFNVPKVLRIFSKNIQEKAKNIK